MRSAPLPFFLALVFSAFVALPARAQRPHQPSSAEIYQDLKKLNVLGNVLYLAAHPDDENTRFIAYAANELLLNTAYLSLTRGDGGQNLIGPELREELGIIRTQELLAARRIDGGTQYFTRANDFGYSKTAEETLEIWDKDKVLSDVVRVIREFRPDVIVCRFPVDGGGGHGHHTASAILGLEAFGIANDASMYPDHFTGVPSDFHRVPWQPKRIVVNTGRWWKTDISADDPGVVSIDVGVYNPVLGTSYGEMAARSRTMHKSQGFGATGTRGEQEEYFEHLAGEQAEDDLFEGVDTTWNRVDADPELLQSIQSQIAAMIDAYDLQAPEKSIDALIALRVSLEQLPDSAWKVRKLEETSELVRNCAGLYMEAVAGDYWAYPGEQVSVDFEVISRNASDVVWNGAFGIGFPESSPIVANHAQFPDRAKLEADKAHRVTTQWSAQGLHLPYSTPYWLEKPGTLGTYEVSNPAYLSYPENWPAMAYGFHLNIHGQPFEYRVPLVYKWNDPVHGERYRPFVVTPPVLVRFEKDSHLFVGAEPKTIRVLVKAVAPGFTGPMVLEPVEGWRFEPESWSLDLGQKGDEQELFVQVTPSEGAKSADLRATIYSSNQKDVYGQSLRTIDYDHIPTQVYMPEAKSRMVYVDLKRKGQRIGYVAGAGDTIPEALRNVGYTVDELHEADMIPEKLAGYDAIITGIRLLNVDDRIGFYMPKLLEYCENGGTLVLQYNTRHALKTEVFSPFPITLSRDRVTEEDAEVRFLQPEHPVLNTPNQLTAADFDGWVQERGLYFPSEWDANYQAILSWNDQGESPKDGSLLVAPFGKGHYVYTGISFFRELPAGVPGAYRLLVNLLSLGHE